MVLSDGHVDAFEVSRQDDARRTLAFAGAGDGRGTARLGAGLELRLPTDTRPGTYQATLTFTVI